MKGLPTLIKLARRELDNIRKRLANLLRQREGLEMVLKNIIEEIVREEELASKDFQLARFFGDFVKRAKARKDSVLQAINDVNLQIERTEKEIYNAFSDLKKLEIAKANGEKKAKQKADKLEADFLDELANGNFLRKEPEE